MSGGWAGSTRSRRLPADWPKRRAQCKKRAGGRCQGLVEGMQCLADGSQCDHIVQGDNHELSNLQWLCDPCHKRKTQAEASASRFRERRPAERAPGLL